MVGLEAGGGGGGLLVEKRELGREAATIKKDKLGYFSLCLKTVLYFYILFLFFKVDSIHCIHSVKKDVLTLWQGQKCQCRNQGDIVEKDPDFGI